MRASDLGPSENQASRLIATVFRIAFGFGFGQKNSPTSGRVRLPATAGSDLVEQKLNNNNNERFPSRVIRKILWNDRVSVLICSSPRFYKEIFDCDFRHAITSSLSHLFSSKLTGLELNTRYYYQVGVPDNGTSEVMSFSTKDGNLVFAVSIVFNLKLLLLVLSRKRALVTQWSQPCLLRGFKNRCSFQLCRY